MPFSGGTLTVTSAGTAEALSGDLDTDSPLRADSRIKSITVIGDQDNTDNVYFGDVAVAAGYGVKLEPGDSFSKVFDGTVKLSDLYGDSDTSGDAMNFGVEFQQ